MTDYDRAISSFLIRRICIGYGLSEHQLRYLFETFHTPSIAVFLRITDRQVSSIRAGLGLPKLSPGPRPASWRMTNGAARPHRYSA